MEGSRFIADYLRNSEPKWIILSEEATPASRTVANDASEAGIDVLEIPPKIFSEISDTAHSQGIIAVCTANPDYDEREWPTARIEVRVVSASGTYEELRLHFTNEDDGTRYSERLLDPGPAWTYEAEGPGEGLFTEGWYTVIAEVDQFDGATRCTNTATHRFHLSDD